ncbi:MAG: SAM-dependent methyltransferase [Lachnospiraceae bacterium]|nr:SAM-dependent methyltransferase [Lachnospiraceae bacterium]
MELSARLEALIGVAEPGCTVADIGTDHGFLPIELVRRGICRRAVACDVRKGPLERAAEHVRQAGLEDRIRICLADGLEGLSPGEADTVVLAGMGGELMATLLEKAAPELLGSIRRLILQPQSEFERLRRAADALGWEPFKEQMVLDRGKYYWLMVCRRKDSSPSEEAILPGEETRKTGDKCCVSEEQPFYEEAWQYKYGKLLPFREDSVFEEYLEKQRRTAEDLLHQLMDIPGEAAALRRARLQIDLEHMEQAKAAKGRS